MVMTRFFELPAIGVPFHEARLTACTVFLDGQSGLVVDACIASRAVVNR